MKKVLVLMTCVFALTACRMSFSNWDSKTIKASKNIVTKEYHLTPFEEVELSCVGAVELIQSESKDGVVELTAPDNYIDLYKFTSNGKKLDGTIITTITRRPYSKFPQAASRLISSMRIGGSSRTLWKWVWRNAQRQSSATRKAS